MGNRIGHQPALSRGFAAFDSHCDEFGGTFAIPHNGLGQLLGNAQHSGLEGLPLGAGQRLERGVRGAVAGNHHQRIVGGGVAIHRDAVERCFGQLQRQLLHDGRADTGIGRNETQHGGHVGSNHAGALADPGDADPAAADVQLRTKGFGHGLGRHDGLAHAQPVVFPRVGQCCVQSGLDAVIGQGLHDDAGGKRQDLLRRQAQFAGQSGAGAQGTGAAVGAGAGIGIARVDQQRPDASAGAGQVLTADLHGCRTEAVLREDAGYRGTRLQQHHRQVFALRFADAGFGNTQTHTGNRVQLGGVGGAQINGHGDSSGKCWII